MSRLRPLIEAFARGPSAMDEAAACFSEHGIFREPRKPAVHGRAAISAHFSQYASSPVAWRFIVEEVLEDGARACVVYRFAVREGQAGPWSERAGCAIVRLDGSGQIAEWREYEG